MDPEIHITRTVVISKAATLSFKASSLIIRLNRLYNKLYLFNNVFCLNDSRQSREHILVSPPRGLYHRPLKGASHYESDLAVRP